MPNKKDGSLTWKKALLWIVLGTGSFHIAWEFPRFNALVFVYAVALIELASLANARVAFRFGFLLGLSVFAPHLAWFWNIFGAVSICLWALLSFFTGLFVFVLKQWRDRLGPQLLWLAAPIFWTGLEYFRSELYFLRFSWLSAGYVFSGKSGLLPVGALGVYGTAFVIFLGAAILCQLDSKRRWIATSLVLLIVGLMANSARVAIGPPAARNLRAAGIQLEFPPDLEIPAHLDSVLAQFPDAELLVLSEYTFDSSVPLKVRQWCRKNRRYLIAGGKDDLPGGQYYNTAFVVDPAGEIVFKQAKSVPIQFFRDGLAAPDRRVWDSPWGKLAICVCYDMSYRRVMDDFIKKGAEALIVPFMDVTDWGGRQHRLHERVSAVRAQEYQIPLFRVGSSGISQLVDRSGRTIATAPFPGQESILGGSLALSAPGRLPLDHWVAPFSTWSVLAWIIFVAGIRINKILRCPARQQDHSRAATQLKI
jgi:apolipoprotein N-acyltransferase